MDLCCEAVFILCNYACAYCSKNQEVTLFSKLQVLCLTLPMVQYAFSCRKKYERGFPKPEVYFPESRPKVVVHG